MDQSDYSPPHTLTNKRTGQGSRERNVGGLKKPPTTVLCRSDRTVFYAAGIRVNVFLANNYDASKLACTVYLVKAHMYELGWALRGCVDDEVLLDVITRLHPTTQLAHIYSNKICSSHASLKAIGVQFWDF